MKTTWVEQTEGSATSTTYDSSNERYFTLTETGLEENMANSKVSELLNQIIEVAEGEDLEHKKKMVEAHNAEKAIGESWMCFHLKRLKELLTENHRV